MNPVLKIAISALIMGAIAEVGRRHSNLAALLTALPLVSMFGILV